MPAIDLPQLCALIPRWTRAALGLALTGLIAACGGDNGASPAQAFVLQMASADPAAGVRQQRLSTPLPGAAISPDEWFGWAERTYPHLFPAGPATQNVVHEGVTYTLRHYATTGQYLGTAAGGQVYVLGGITNHEIRNYGHLSFYTCLVDAAKCDAPPGARQRVAFDPRLVQCQESPTLTEVLQQQRQRLLDAGVETSAGLCGWSGLMSCSACGCADTRIVVFDVPSRQAPQAYGLGMWPYTDSVLAFPRGELMVCR